MERNLNAFHLEELKKLGVRFVPQDGNWGKYGWYDLVDGETEYVSNKYCHFEIIIPSPSRKGGDKLWCSLHLNKENFKLLKKKLQIEDYKSEYNHSGYDENAYTVEAGIDFSNIDDVEEVKKQVTDGLYAVYEKVKEFLPELFMGTKEKQENYIESFSKKLVASKNIIFHGAPGTGKTYLAKQVASDIVSNGSTRNYEDLTDEKSQIGFVQFHPSYDYSDFVEGLRPVVNKNSSEMTFRVRDGIFKNFIEKAKSEFESGSGKKFVFIIDEINRGEISKIFGELFFSIDPGYRGEAGAVLTQYSYLHDNPDEKFYIPENVYIIGTMNDIDRSVDSFDFAMRRRFRFINITAEERADDMFEFLDEKYRDAVKNRMTNLNKAIAETPDLNENYQIGPAYFLKLEELGYDKNGFNSLWKDYLEPLLQDYVMGMGDANGLMKKFKDAYDNPEKEKSTNGTNQTAGADGETESEVTVNESDADSTPDDEQ